MLTPFHLAYNVRNLDAARIFYVTILGCTEGRSTETWIDFNFFGHQLSLHLGEPFQTSDTGHVGGHLVPMPHLGIVLTMPAWQAVADRLVSSKLRFILPPSIRFAGEPGEQATMFFRDPSGNPIEIKGFSDIANVFAT